MWKCTWTWTFVYARRGVVKCDLDLSFMKFWSTEEWNLESRISLAFYHQNEIMSMLG